MSEGRSDLSIVAAARQSPPKSSQDSRSGSSADTRIPLTTKGASRATTGWERILPDVVSYPVKVVSRAVRDMATEYKEEWKKQNVRTALKDLVTLNTAVRLSHSPCDNPDRVRERSDWVELMRSKARTAVSTVGKDGTMKVLSQQAGRTEIGTGKYLFNLIALAEGECRDPPWIGLEEQDPQYDE